MMAYNMAEWGVTRRVSLCRPVLRVMPGLCPAMPRRQASSDIHCIHSPAPPRRNQKPCHETCISDVPPRALSSWLDGGWGWAVGRAVGWAVGCPPVALRALWYSSEGACLPITPSERP